MTTQQTELQTPFLIWKHVPGYVNVQVNQYGQARDSGTHELLNFAIQNTYYSLWCKRVGDASKAYMYVHSLVLLAFKGERPTGYHTDHKDGDRLNNVLSNLHYVTRSENMRNRKDQVTVMYNGEDTVLIEALEDLFGKELMSTASGQKLFKRIAINYKRGKTFDDAIQFELKKNGWPTLVIGGDDV